MCQQCNETLSVAASAALDLAKAAKALYEINEHGASAILAKAAAELFKPVEEDKVATPGGPKKANGEAGKPEAASPFDSINKSLPPGAFIDVDGVLYLDGKAIGTAVLVRS